VVFTLLLTGNLQILIATFGAIFAPAVFAHPANLLSL
jgi:hypothetical protein